MTRILDRYIVKELGPPFAIGVGVFTFFLVIDRIYQLTDLVITKNVPFVLVMPLLIYMLPAFLALTLPMATLVAVLLVTGRLAGDLEVAALKASGVSPLRLLLTVLDITRDRSGSTPAPPSGRRRAGRSPTGCSGGSARRTG
ncbi:MAG TPA: LptF/LptG family permease [Methylomirabilota bacterium]|jgi:lipopolysaccharide export system permease protein|nr:LptF/LptG family permease [Methylomirabilota bacterium]